MIRVSKQWQHDRVEARALALDARTSISVAAALLARSFSTPGGGNQHHDYAGQTDHWDVLHANKPFHYDLPILAGNGRASGGIVANQQLTPQR
jgi:hypothetical protein